MLYGFVIVELPGLTKQIGKKKAVLNKMFNLGNKLFNLTDTMST